MHALSVALVVAAVLAARPVAAAPTPGRGAGASGSYLHTRGLDGGAVAVWWREPLGRAVTVDGTLGVAIGTGADRTTAATLTNPSVAVGAPLAAGTTGYLRLTLPAASRAGAAGRLATALAAARLIDPAPWQPRTTTLEAGLGRRWRRGLGEVSLDAGLAWLAVTDASDLPLVHVDAAGAVALARGLALTARVRTTAYVLAADKREGFVHTLAVGARLRAGPAEVDLAFEVPVDRADRAVDTLAATAAVRWQL
ncbi:MAG: hypothetical protein R3B06_10050 [Kofleriaceae bacterium]